VRLGVQRVLERVASGRAFLQEHGPRFDYSTPSLQLLRGPPERAPARLDPRRQPPPAGRRAAPRSTWPTFLELKHYQCFALDGHWPQAATHDARHEGTKMAGGHFYSLDLRGHQLRHLAAGEGLHEHDMSVLKRLKPSGLRHDVPKGTRVLLIDDKAGIAFAYWPRCQRECAVYCNQPGQGGHGL